MIETDKKEDWFQVKQGKKVREFEDLSEEITMSERKWGMFRKKPSGNNF